MNHYDFIMAFECGEIESEEELIDGFQAMIDDGTVWQLQGTYGRTAMNLIEAGLCHNHPPHDMLDRERAYECGRG